MKKIVIVSIIFVIMFGAGIWEMSYSTRLFSNLKTNLDRVEQSIYSSGDTIANAETLSHMDSVVTTWKKGRKILFCLGNHNTFRTLEEKIISLDTMIKINYVDDAKITVAAAKSLVEALNNDTHLVWTNIF